MCPKTRARKNARKKVHHYKNTHTHTHAHTRNNTRSMRSPHPIVYHAVTRDPYIRIMLVAILLVLLWGLHSFIFEIMGMPNLLPRHAPRAPPQGADRGAPPESAIY